MLPGRGPPALGAAFGAGAAGAAATGAGAAGASATAAAGAGLRPGLAGVAALGPGTAARAAVVFSAAAGFSGAVAAGVGAVTVFALAGLAGAAGLGVDAGAAGAPGNASRSFFTTGASMVEEAERTNSPSSWSLLTASFEVIPSSFASSWTRALATFLLSRPAPDRYEPLNSYCNIPCRNGRRERAC